MSAYLEVWTPAGRELVALEAGRLTLGADPANDLPLPADPTLSRLHAVLERYEAGWCVRDLDSRNGTFVNGQRIWGERPLRPGDELRVGATRLIYRGDEPAAGLVAAVDQPGGPHPQLVPGTQGAFAPDPLAVDEGAVAGVQVAHRPAGLVALQHRMQPRQRRVISQGEVIGRIGAEGQPPGLQGHQLPAGRRPHLQVPTHHQRPQPGP